MATTLLNSVHHSDFLSNDVQILSTASPTAASSFGTCALSCITKLQPKNIVAGQGCSSDELRSFQISSVFEPHFRILITSKTHFTRLPQSPTFTSAFRPLSAASAESIVIGGWVFLARMVWCGEVVNRGGGCRKRHVGFRGSLRCKNYQNK